MSALIVEGLRIAYPGVGTVVELSSLSLPSGATAAIAGPSGAGKSSLLHALAGIERPAAGRVLWDGVDIWALPAPARDRWRRERVGLVFQDMHLLDGLSARDNVLLPTLFDHRRPPAALQERAGALLDSLSIADPRRRAAVMSRGERQRVALARALLRSPTILLADEPTASLDAAAAAGVGAMLLDVAAQSGAALLVATHDPALLGLLPRQIRLHAGQVAA